MKAYAVSTPYLDGLEVYLRERRGYATTFDTRKEVSVPDGGVHPVAFTLSREQAIDLHKSLGQALYQDYTPDTEVIKKVLEREQERVDKFINVATTLQRHIQS